MKEFLGTYYIIFIIISIILIFALIGYFIDKKYPDEVKVVKEKELSDNELLKQQVSAKGSVTLQETVNNNNHQPTEQAPTNQQSITENNTDNNVDSLY